jgi:hypothetical protein
MFSSDDHQFQQQAACNKTRAELVESPKTLCSMHEGRGTCTVLDCTTTARSQGRLSEHGGKGVCTLPACSTSAHARGLCGKHGGKGVCKHPGCTTSANARGLCCKHGGDIRSVCGHPGCTTKAKARGLCHSVSSMEAKVYASIQDARPTQYHAVAVLSMGAVQTVTVLNTRLSHAGQRMRALLSRMVKGCALNQTAGPEGTPEAATRSSIGHSTRTRCSSAWKQTAPTKCRPGAVSAVASNTTKYSILNKPCYSRLE